MPTKLDQKLRPKIEDIIDRLGKKVTVQETERTYDPASGRHTTLSKKEHTPKASPPDGFESYLIDGERVLATDTRILLAATAISFEPKAEWKVTIESETFWIVRVRKIYSGEQVAAYELQLRS